MDTTDTARSVVYLALHMQMYSECRLRTKHYDKIYVFNFRRVTFQFIYSNNQAATAYAVYDLV
jgi:hypothetical protein